MCLYVVCTARIVLKSTPEILKRLLNKVQLAGAPHNCIPTGLWSMYFLFLGIYDIVLYSHLDVKWFRFR